MEVEGCSLPEDRLYDFDGDVWLVWAADHSYAEVGVVSHLVAFAGKMTSVSFRVSSGPIERGRSLGTLESVRYTGAVRSPVTGEVVAVNQALITRPKLINDQPYAEGWFARLKPSDPEHLPSSLETASAVRERMEERIRTRRVHCFPAAPDVELYEIGAECSAILARLDDELTRRSGGDVVLLVVDDPTAPIEMVRWSDRTGHTVLAHRREGALHHFLVRKEARPQPRKRGQSGP